ncbi:hypothetical protein FRC04_005962 [Tulasnella sp. 424]|nr:hypothetical protein FRC04_005962 [Tulasnella sp. 424]
MAHIPDFPPEFGEDKGKFFEHYDKIQDELDEEMVKRLKENLDGILVFAGLFAGVNSAFLANTLNLVQPNPLDDISSLLQQLVQGLQSFSLPSITFTPSLRALVINGLFGLSLSSALFASFFAVLGKQWLMFYRNRDGGGVDQQRWEQLRRSLGAERWGLVPVLEVVLPMFIQTALVIFTLGFVLYLRTMSEALSNFVLVPLVVTVFLSFLTVGFSLWDYSCPFRTPLSEIVFRVPSLASVIGRVIRQAKLQLFRILKKLRKRMKRLQERKRDPRASSNEDGSTGDSTGEGGEVVKSGVYCLYDEEKGNPAIGVEVRSVQASPVPQDAGHHRSGRERWRSVMHAVMRKRRRAMMNPESGFWRLIRLGREVEEEEVLHVVAIMRVIRISEDPKALYHAALNLRSITDPKLLALVCDDELTTRGLRECYSEALEDLDKKHTSAKSPESLLRKTLGFGTAFFHVAISAESFDDFIDILGMKSAFLPLITSEMSPEAAQIAGDICRRAQTFVRGFMNLQLRQIGGAQPGALTTTTLAANALWFAINGIPHSQDIVFGDRFRGALAYSEISWAGLGLLASVSNLICRFHDARKRKPYGLLELEWCRFAFLRVREAYYLSKPTPELADAIRDSFNSRRNLESNAILFKFTWRLFTREDDGDKKLIELAEHALSAGQHLICAIEGSIRFSKDGKKYATAREMCFKAMMENMGPRGGEMKALKGVAWRQRLMLTTATDYMRYIMGLEGRVNEEQNAYAKGVMEQIRGAQIQSLRTLLAMGKEYADAKREFEETFSKFSLYDVAESVISGDR